MAAGNDKYTQDGHILKLTTPLGKDVLLIESIVGHEAISKLFLFRIDALHAATSETAPPKVIKPSEILGMGIAVELVQPDGTKRLFHGMVNRLSQGGRDADFTSYQIEVVPQLWLLTKSKQSRIFQQMSVPDILRKVFNGFKFKMQVQRQYQPRNYCVQYRESDFDFASRIMEEEGIFYFFEHTSDSHTLIIADKQDGHLACPFKNSVDFAAENTEEKQTPVVYDWRLDYEIQPGKFQFWDNNFQLPNKTLEASWNSRYTDVGNKNLEVYEYPGTFAKKFDGIDKGGGEQASNLEKVFKDNRQVAESTADVFDTKFRTYRGGSDCSSFTAGHKFKIAHLPIKEDDREYVLTSVQFNYHQSPSYRPTIGTRRSILNRFECIPVGDGKFPTFRPQQTTPKPTVYGSQTAYVVGPPGEEIYTDKYGRVKVQFHWDRHGQKNEGSACWMRVSQPWAGKQWGTMFIPRIGMEVVVQFLEGDPDQPIIVGCVYNPENMPPYELPKHKTRSTIKSNKSKGGGGSNEIRFEDAKGEEQIFIHGEKNLDIRIKNDAKQIIMNDQHLIVNNDKKEKIKGDYHLDVVGDIKEKATGSVSTSVTGNIQQKTSGKWALEASNEIHIKSGMKVVIEAGAQVTLKGPGGFVDIGPTGVTIQGTMVLINSGGAAGAGSGSSPDSPGAPQEADDSNSGQSTESAPPPDAPEDYSPEAKSQTQAAESGAPYCDGSSGGSSEQSQSSEYSEAPSSSTGEEGASAGDGGSSGASAGESSAPSETASGEDYKDSGAGSDGGSSSSDGGYVDYPSGSDGGGGVGGGQTGGGGGTSSGSPGSSGGQSGSSGGPYDSGSGGGGVGGGQTSGGGGTTPDSPGSSGGQSGGSGGPYDSGSGSGSGGVGGGQTSGGGTTSGSPGSSGGQSGGSGGPYDSGSGSGSGGVGGGQTGGGGGSTPDSPGSSGGQSGGSGGQSGGSGGPFESGSGSGSGGGGVGGGQTGGSGSGSDGGTKSSGSGGSSGGAGSKDAPGW